MPVFLIPVILIGGGVATATGGLASVVRGRQTMAKAQRIAAEAQKRYDDALEETKVFVAETDVTICAYGREQQVAMEQVIDRTVAFLLSHDQAVAQSLANLLDGSEVTLEELAGLTRQIHVADIMRGAIQAVGAGTAVFTGVPTLVGAMASASTGTAISGLSGAAAQNAILAWLGGGSMAAGGGGMALGAMALNASVAGPVLLIGGLVLNGQAEKAQSRAEEYQTKVAINVAEQRLFQTTLSGIQSRVEELSTVLHDLVCRATVALDDLEAVEFDPDKHVHLLSVAVTYATAVKALVDTPLLTEGGKLNHETQQIVLTYQNEGTA